MSDEVIGMFTLWNWKAWITWVRVRATDTSALPRSVAGGTPALRKCSRVQDLHSLVRSSSTHMEKIRERLPWEVYKHVCRTLFIRLGKLLRILKTYFAYCMSGRVLGPGHFNVEDYSWGNWNWKVWKTKSSSLNIFAWNCREPSKHLNLVLFFHRFHNCSTFLLLRKEKHKDTIESGCKKERRSYQCLRLYRFTWELLFSSVAVSLSWLMRIMRTWTSHSCMDKRGKFTVLWEQTAHIRQRQIKARRTYAVRYAF